MSNLDALKEEYDLLFEREKKVDQELQMLLNNQSMIDSKFNSIKSIHLNVQLISKDSQNLSNMINFTTNLADNVSNKVRQLDLAKGRVTNCIKRVTDILDLKACTDGVTEALGEEDYESAANHIYRYSSLDKDSLQLKCASSDLNEKNYLDQSFAVLHESKTRLQQIVNEKYDLALRHNDVPELERFFKIFPLIGLSENGLEKFSHYLCLQITQAAEKNFVLILNADISESRWNIMFADSLIMLFEKVARIIEAYQPVIESYYGPGNIFLFLKNIQRECDSQSIRILNKFKEVRNLAFIFKTVQTTNSSNYARPTSINNLNLGTSQSQKIEDKIEPRDIDELLTEITLISARCELYKNFLLRSIVNDLNGNGKSNSKSQPLSDEVVKKKMTEAQQFINSSLLNSTIQELVGQYSILENYFMTENIYKAIQFDTIVDDSLTSSVVDDVFFIIKKCINDSVDGCCAMFNNSSNVLESLYKDHFFAKLKLGYPSGFESLGQAYTAIQRRFQTTEQMEKQKLHFLITLNNIEHSIECITMIKKLFEDDISKLFVQESNSSKEKLASCLSDLNSVNNRFKELLEFGFNQLNSNEIKPKIKQWCEVYNSINHKINDDEYDSFTNNDPFVQTLVRNIDQMILALKTNLSTKNQDAFSAILASETALLLEKNILKCAFNKYGGMQLDKEVRFLINYLTSITSWSTREKFSRLTQISILLSLENLNELFEYWNSPLTITWRLTPNEIRQILTLRVDFKAEEIKSLKL